MNTSLIVLFLVFLFGAFIGSFLNVLTWRLPKNKTINGRSKCPHCDHQLIWMDLIPLVSFLLYGAKCRYCKAKISWRYPLMEVVTGLLFVLAVLIISPSEATLYADWGWVVKYWFIFSVLLIVFVIDLEHYLILNKVIFPSIIVVLLMTLFLVVGLSGDSWSSYSSYLLDSVLGMIAGFIPFYLLWKVSKGKWMGLGDAKFGLFLGAVFGFPLVWACIFIAFILGTIAAIPLLLSGKRELSSKLPFGTFLALSAVITLWYGYQMVHWYFNLIGIG